MKQGTVSRRNGPLSASDRMDVLEIRLDRLTSAVERLADVAVETGAMSGAQSSPASPKQGKRGNGNATGENVSRSSARSLVRTFVNDDGTRVAVVGRPGARGISVADVASVVADLRAFASGK